MLSFISQIFSDAAKPLFTKMSLFLLGFFLLISFYFLVNVALMLSFHHYIWYIVLGNFVLYLIALIVVYSKWRLEKRAKASAGKNVDAINILATLATRYLEKKLSN